MSRIPARFKLLALIIISTALFMVESWPILGTALGVVVGIYFLSGLHMRDVVTQLRPTLWVLVLIFLVQSANRDWIFAAAVVMRFAAVLLLAGWVTLTTRTSELIETMTNALRWLKPFGVNPAKVSLALSLTLRFLPMIAEIAAEVREAQKARGLEHSWLAMAFPLIIRTLKTADAVAEALDARGYDP